MKKHLLLFTLLLLVSGAMYAEELPTVTTDSVTNIQQTTATCGGNVTEDGGAAVTARGVCWSTSQNPELGDNNFTTDGDGTGMFTSNITDLSPNTTYYVRAYATNSEGTAYGNEVNFTTLQSIPLSIQIDSITSSTVYYTVSGNDPTLLEHGICWSTSQNPTYNNNHVSGGSNYGSFSVELDDLQPGTTYYVRAYCTNSAGIAYGNEESFTTQASLPTVMTNSITNITQTTATGGGSVISDGGGMVTQRGVCWSTSHDPTISNNHTSNGFGTGPFTSNLTGLTANTTYYVRAYATNSEGTAYGNEVIFTTEQLQTYNITTDVSPSNSGYVSGSGPYQQEATCTLTATANEGYSFVNWTKGTEEISTHETYAFTVTETANYTAHFNLNSYEITATANPVAGGTVTGGGTYPYGEQAKLKATANIGYRWIGWKENGDLVSSDPSYSFTVNCDRNLEAHFEAKTYNIATYANPSNGGSVSGEGSYSYGQSCTLIAQANESQDFAFYSWTNTQGDEFITDTICFVVDSTTASTYTAHFIQPQLIGDNDVCHNEKSTYYVTGIDNALRYHWETTDPYATIEGSGDTVSVHWRTCGEHDLTVTILRLGWSPIVTKHMSVKVTSEINEEELNQIQEKKLNGSGSTYILVYPNPEADYNYQWFRNDTLVAGANKQYLYQNGGLPNGMYKVYVSKKADENGDLVCGAFSPEKEVNNSNVIPSRLFVYPNPSPAGTNLVIVSDNEDETSLSIYSIDGKLLHSQTVTGSQATIGINLPQGLYVARLANGHDVKVEKIVIQ